MKRREFLRVAAAGTLSAGVSSLASGTIFGASHTHSHDSCGPTYASPDEAMQSPQEKLLYTPCIYAGTNVKKPDYLATIDVDPGSPRYGQVVHRLEMPHAGDELHHFGWNACSSCHGDPQHMRRYLVIPGIASSRIYIVDAHDPAAPKLFKVIEGDEIKRRVGLSAPHTVHCLSDGRIMISMLGDAQGNGPGGFLLLDDQFNIAGSWAKNQEGMRFNYDFWYQPRHNVMISSEWAAPKTVAAGFKPDDVAADKYGHRLHFWDWNERVIRQSIDLGEGGRIPLEVRFHHDPASTHGFVGAALSSSIWHWHKPGPQWAADKIIQVDAVPVEGWSFPVPGLITDLVLSLDDRFLYFSNWLHGDVRQYDVSDPAHPRLTGQLWLGGVLGKAAAVGGKKLTGGPQMLQLSLDGRRLYVTNSLYSPWDNQFYPDIAKQGSWLVQIDCDTQQGGLRLNPKLHIDFGLEPHGPARAHEMRFPGGDSTSDIWV